MPVDTDLAEPLPLEARNAFAELLMHALASADARVAIADALAALRGESPRAGDPRATEALVEAGFEERVPWRGRARARLSAYERVLDEVPNGTDLEQRLGQAESLFAADLYFEVHEVLEPAWLEAEGRERAWLQGLIQAAVAWHHFDAGNRKGATSLALAAAEKLEGAPDRWHGFPLEEAASRVSAWAAWITRDEREAEPLRFGAREGA